MIPVRSVAFASHQPVWVAGDENGVLAVYSTRRDEKKGFEFKLHSGSIESLESDADGALVSASRDGSVRLWEFTGLPDRLRHIAVWHCGEPLSCATFAKDGRTIVAISAGGNIYRLDRTRLSDRVRVLAPFADGGCPKVEFSADSQSLIANLDGIVLLNAETGAEMRRITPEDQPAGWFALSPDRNLLAAREAGAVGLWDVASGKRLRAVPNGRKQAVDPTRIDLLEFIGRTASVMAGEEGELLHSGAAGRQIERNDIEPFVHSRKLAFSPDGRRFAAIGSERKYWELTVGELAERRPTTLTGRFDSIAFSSDGSLLAAGGLDGSISLWGTDAWSEARVISGHAGVVSALAFSPDGRTLASTGVDGFVKLWHVPSGAALVSFAAHTAGGQHLAFSPDGRRLASSGHAAGAKRRREIQIWNAAAAAAPSDEVTDER